MREGGVDGSPTTYRRPPMASPMAPKPACREYGPVCPKPDTRIMISRGLMDDNSLQPRPHFSIVPGRKFSSTKSAFRTSSRRSSCPSAWRRSSVTAFLLRATTGHQREGSPCFCRPQTLMGSPWFGGSTLITSAPMSPRICPQKGPASNVPISMTRRSDKGPFLKLVSAMVVFLAAVESVAPRSR